MKHFFSRLTAILALSLFALALAACGGDHDKDKQPDRKPAFDVSGDWRSNMDGNYLGKFTFKMSSKGELSGKLVTDHGDKASVSGLVAGYKSEFTLSFPDAAYLAAIEFKSDHSNASGTLVDNGGRLHPLTLYK